MEQKSNESVTQLLVRISLNYIQLNLVTQLLRENFIELK